MENNQPGQVVAPGGTPTEPTPNLSGAPEPERLPEVVSAPPAPQAPQTEAPLATAEAVEPTGWQFTGQTAGDSGGLAVGNDHTFQTVPVNEHDELSWTAAEFVAHDKSPLWHVILFLAALGGSTGLYLITKDKISAGIALFVALIFGVFAARKPRVQQYVLNAHGIIIGTKHYIFQNFKSFSITDDGATASVVFMPLKRFMPALTIYVVPDMEEQVIDFLSGLLPFEQHRQDAVDSFLKRIRF